MKKILVIFSVIIGIIILATCVLLYQLSTIEIRQTKDYAEIYVDDTFNYEMMLYPTERYSALYQVDVKMREKVSDYMKENGYVLKKGRQEFIRNNPTFEELIEEGFVFERETK